MTIVLMILKQYHLENRLYNYKNTLESILINEPVES